MAQSILACRLDVLTPEQQTRRGSLENELLRAIGQVIELTDGVLLEIGERSGLSDQDLAEFVDMEMRCCPFLDFDLQDREEPGPRRLRIRGPEGVKTFLLQQFGLGDGGGEEI